MSRDSFDDLAFSEMRPRQVWMCAAHEAMLEERPFSWTSQRPLWDTMQEAPEIVEAMKGLDALKMTGWSAAAGFPDPEGLDYTDPFVIGLMAGRTSKTLIILSTAGLTGEDFRRLYFQDWSHIEPIMESPPCALSAKVDLYEKQMEEIGRRMLGIPEDRLMKVSDVRVDADGQTHAESYECFMEASPLEVLREMQKHLAAREALNDMRFDDPHIDQLLGGRRLRADDLRELKMMAEARPEPIGRRYGPYDADPHAKGRRRRFRKQRRAS